MTETEHKKAIKDLITTVIVGIVLIYSFFILAFIFDIH